MKKTLSSIVPILVLAAAGMAATPSFADGTLAGVHKGKQGDPIPAPIHRIGKLTPAEIKPGHAAGAGEFHGGTEKGVTRKERPEPTHSVAAGDHHLESSINN